MAKFRKVNLEISRAGGYGQYYITAKYRGVDVKAYTTDAETYDYLNDSSNLKKHLDAKRFAYRAIVNAYRS